MNTKNVIKQKYDPVGYQWQDSDGEVYQITDLSKEDLLQVVCDCMEAIETIEANVSRAQHSIDNWRIGKTEITPE